MPDDGSDSMAEAEQPGAPLGADAADLLPSGRPAAPRPAPSAGLGATPEGAAGGSRTTIHWRSLSDGLIFAMVVTGPCLLAAEGLRDRVGRLWLIPIVIAGVGFLIAGAIAGRHRRRLTGAVSQGFAVALPVSVLLVLVDVLYRAIGGRPINGRVVVGWILGIVVAIVLGALGAAIGRWSYLRRWHNRSSSSF